MHVHGSMGLESQGMGRAACIYVPIRRPRLVVVVRSHGASYGRDSWLVAFYEVWHVQLTADPRVRVSNLSVELVLVPAWSIKMGWQGSANGSAAWTTLTSDRIYVDLKSLYRSIDDEMIRPY